MKQNALKSLWLSALGITLIAACYPPHGSRAARTELIDTAASDTVAARPIPADTFRDAVLAQYRRVGLELTELDTGVFTMAYTGYLNLRASGRTNSSILTIVDFNVPSTEHRMWIVDLAQDSLLLHTWSAHGEGSGR